MSTTDLDERRQLISKGWVSWTRQRERKGGAGTARYDAEGGMMRDKNRLEFNKERRGGH